MAQHKTIDRRKAATDAQSVARRLAEQKRAQPTAPAARTAATPATGGYHSPREYGGQRDFYEARVTQTRTAMEQQQAAFREAQKALEASRRQADEQQKRYESLKDKFRGETAEQYRKQLMDQWTSAVQEYKTAQGAYDNAWTAYQPYEDAYNRSVDEYNSYIRGEQEAYRGWKATIRGADEIREEQKTVKGKRAELQRRMQMANDIAAGTAAPGIMAQAAQNEAAIRELQEYLGGTGDREKLLQEELDWSEHFRFEDLRKNGDFGEKSRFTGVDNQGDRVYQYVNGNPNAVSGSIDALLDRGTQDDLLLQMTGGNDGWRDIIGYNETPTYLEHMTEDEKAMYNYVYSTQGREAAQGYLDHLKPELTARKTGTVTKFWRMLAGQNALTGALYSGLSVPMNAAGGIQAGLGQVASALRGEELDPNASYNLMANTKNAIRDEVSGKIQEHAGPVGSFAYGAVMSIADMAMDAAAGNPAAATALIGTRAFSEQVIDSKKRGLSDEQALTMGITSAFAELVTEKLGLDELLHLPDKWATAGFWKGAARGAGGEALEEGLTNLMNLAADISIAGDKSEFAQSVERYKAEGLSEEKAVWKALGDAGWSLAADMAGGAISGGVYGGYRGYKGKKITEAQEKKEGAAQAQQEAAPSVSEADSSPIPDGTGEPLGDGAQAVPYEEKAVTAQNGESDVQKTDGRQEEPDAHLPGPEDFVGREGEYPGGAEAWLKDAREDGLVVDADENGGKHDEGEHLLSGGPERHDAPGAGEPVERYEVRRERQQAEARSQTETAAQRRVKAENLERLGKAQRVSSKDLGLKQGTEVKELLELPRYEWDEELWETVSRIEKETGYKVRTVTGNIGVRLKDGGVGLCRGYIDRVSRTIVMNVAHTQVTAGQLGDHEIWHWKMDTMDRVSGDRYEMTRAAVQRIQEEYDPEDFDAVLDKYIDGYGDVYDMDAPDFLDRIYEEIIADAYAGINAFGADAAKYRSTVDAVMAENGMGRNVWNAQEQEDYAAPGGDQRVYTDEDAPPPRDEDFSQVPQEDDWDGWDDSMIDFSMEGGESLNAIEKKWAEQTKWLFLHENADTVFLDNMVVKEELRDQGIGTKILEDVIAYADARGKTIALTPTSEFGTKKRLTSWYKKHGFVENKGRNTDFRLRDTMYRLPKAAGDDVRFSMDSEGRELTAEQQAFFRDSKVRDEQGRLMVVYHGTDEKFSKFSSERIGSNTENGGFYGRGFYFSTSEEDARNYGKRVERFYLNAKKPLDLDDDNWAYELGLAEKKSVTVGRVSVEKLPKGFLTVHYTTMDAPNEWKSFDKVSPLQLGSDKSGRKFVQEKLGARPSILPRDVKNISELAMKKGYDAIIGAGTNFGDIGKEIVVFASNQIKSVNNAEPTDDPDIRFSMEDGSGEQELVERMAGVADAAFQGAVDANREMNAAKAERKRQSEQRQMERNRERAQQHKEERQRLRREANAVMTDDLQQFGKPQWAKRDTTKRIMDLFDTPAGMKNETKALIGEYLDHILEKGYIEDDDRRTLMTKLIERGVVEIEPDEIMSEGRSYLKGNKIYVSDSLRQEFGDDWNSVRKKAFGLGLYLVDDQQQAGVDQWWQDMNGYLPGMFSAEETNQRTMLERLLWIAEEGKAEKLSLAEYTQRLAKQGQVTEAELLDGLAEKLEQELKQFARDADVEMRLRDQTHRKVTWYRLQRAADKAHYRETMQTTRNRRELNKLQERTLKTLQWLNKNKYRASEEIQAQIQEVLSDIDLYAVGAANELNWHPKYEMTWRDLAEVYKEAKARNEKGEANLNFFRDKELERIVTRLDARKIEDLDVGALNDLFNAAVAIRKAIFDADKALSFATDQEFDKIYQSMTTEMHLAKKPKKGSVQDKFFNIEQLTPMNVLRQMGGWRPDGTFAKMAGVLEQGEKEVRAYKVKANRILADWLEAHRDWVHKADGQGKDGLWIEVDVPRLEDIGLDGGATFGETVKVKMTPMQRVHMYLESRNEDNLRHMVGGRTFADPELYSQGKRTEAYAKGVTVKMAPETVRALVTNMTQEELELARLLDSYYNGLAHDEINRVSNKLYGYNKAMGKRYAPIFTNQNFTKSEAGLYDQTAEGVGNLKERMHAGNPSYNISALDAFERNVDKTAEFVGMAIPVRDWNSLMNWRTRDSSMKDQITHEWGQGRLEYIDKLLVDLQGGAPAESDVMQELGDTLLSNYISSIFGFNPSIVLKQAGSLPLAAAYLGAENMSFDMLRKERRSREFIAKYTQELQWRSMGYDMPETKQLKDKPGWAQKSGKKWVEDVFGGGYITKMDEATASVLWAWAENKVRAEHPGLEVGDQKTIDEGNSPFYQKVAEEFDRAVSHSQSVSDVAHQSTMRRSKGVLARTFTMFRSDSAQTYNALRQMWGEKEYWQTQVKAYEKASSERDKELLRKAQEQQEKAAKRIGTVVVAMASNALLAELVDFAMAAIKGKLDRYEDEEEERLTAMSVLGEMGWGAIESTAGVVVWGDEIAGLLGRFATGKKGYGEEAPGLEQLLDLEDRIASAVEGVKKGDILGAVREVGMAFSTYYAGFPAENMEKFLISGLGKHLAPGLVAGYEDMLEAPQKSDLKGMKGAALETRLGHVMKEYGMDLDGKARAALAKAYEAGYTDAVPSAAPAKATIDGKERKLGKQAQRQYDKIRAQVVNGELAAVLASPFFREADGKTQAKMLNRLYEYAGEKAKKEILEGYKPSDSLAEYAEIARAGGSIADCVIFRTETADMKNNMKMKSYMKADLLREWDAEDEAKRLMFHYLISGSYEEEMEKLGKVGLGVDQFLELYAMHGQIDDRDDISATDKATEFAYWLDGQRYTQAQKAAVRSELAFFQFMPAEAARYNTATEAGLDRDDALELTGKLNELEPPEGKTSVQQIQKWRVGIDNAWGPENQLQQLKAVGMDEKTYAKCEALWGAGVAPAAYVRAQEIKSQFDSDGNGSLTNEDWRNLINSLVPSGIALPGDNERFNMTNEQMGFLWQMLTGSKSTKNNPFSAAGGEKWLAIKNADK